MDTLKIIKKYYNPGSKEYRLLIAHSKKVTEKAIKIAEKVKYLNPDIVFIKEAAMLHDIGVFLTKEFGGEKPYVCHGYLGREILEKESLSRHALVCERHVGVGITKEDIEKQNLPLPKKDMVPVSIEEKIICFSDKFFSKIEDETSKESSSEEIKKELSKFGEDKVKKFEELLKLFDN